MSDDIEDVRAITIKLKRGDVPEMFDTYPYETIAWDEASGQLVFGGDVSWNPNRHTPSGEIVILGPATEDNVD